MEREISNFLINSSNIVPVSRAPSGVGVTVSALRPLSQALCCSRVDVHYKRKISVSSGPVGLLQVKISA